ncbi:zinc finger protein 567-like isoform X1 [Mytilus californianus]|uniref:zinc finger protein 567-like isoform X1 n=2 Tax=Mytilus californianus TaxID=6549 RepID=UPI0022450D4D|nr:zinc finger protein 567-like isoform X1 [Mytilus californianus]
MKSAEAVCLDCCVCGRESKEMRLIGSKRTINLSELLAKYGGISKQQGKICRNCFDRLKTVHKNASKIRQQCLNTQAKTKQCHQALQALLTNVNEESLKDGKEIYVQVQAIELARFKEENLMPEELIYKPVTIDMKEKIKYLEMEILQLKSDLQYLRELHKTNIRIMTNSWLESMQKLMNKVSGITANEEQKEDILDDTEISINKPFSFRMKDCSSNAMDHLYCKDFTIKEEPESDIDDATKYSLPSDQFQNWPVTLNAIKKEQQLPSLCLNISNIRTLSGEISDDVTECSTTMTPQNINISNMRRKRTSTDENNDKNEEVKSLKLDNIDHQNIIEEKTSVVSLNNSVTKPFVVVGEHYKQIAKNTTQQLQNILNLSHLNVKKENIATNENKMTHKPIIFPVIIPKILPAEPQVLRNELLKQDVIIGGSPFRTENTSMKNQVVFNVNSSPKKEQTEKASYSASFQVKYHKICPKPSNDVDVSKLPECGNDGMEVKAEETKIQNYYPRPQLPIPNKSQICYVCGKFIEKRDSMTSHLKTHNEKMFKCNICDRAFSRKHHMMEHLNTHSRVKPYVCHLCGKGIRFESSFIKHMKIHKGDKRYPCDDCGKRFMDNSSLLKHRRKWHESNKLKTRKPQTFTCKTSGCGKKYLDICELRKHQLEHPSEIHITEPNVCPDCGEGFDNEEACKKHIPVHLENLPYGCGTCGKSFSKTVHLQAHMAVHTKKSKFRCSTCSLLFFTAKSFTEHIKTHKYTENMCDDCGQSFPDVRTLEDHISEHSREDLLYGCGFCDKGFSKPSHLKYHMKKHEFVEEDSHSMTEECRNVDNNQ